MFIEGGWKNAKDVWPLRLKTMTVSGFCYDGSQCCGASPLVAGLQEVSMIYCEILFFTTTKAWLLHSTSPSTFPSVKFVMFIFH